MVEASHRHPCSDEGHCREQGLGPTVVSLAEVESVAISFLSYGFFTVSPQVCTLHWRLVVGIGQGYAMHSLGWLSLGGHAGAGQ